MIMTNWVSYVGELNIVFVTTFNLIKAYLFRAFVLYSVSMRTYKYRNFARITDGEGSALKVQKCPE